MATTALVLLAVAAALAAASARPHNEAVSDQELRSLPGWDGPLLSRVFAGYISAGSEDGYDMHEHYMFIESEGDPATDPLIIWTNGGPGAPSFFGLFIELGPYYVDIDSLNTAAYNATGIPTLFLNPNRWTKVANILILNSPPPVGYSYCDPAGPAGDGNSCGAWNDTRTAVHNYDFLKNWLALFPQFASNPCFVIGESYAGVYVPTLVREILAQDPTLFNLQGFAIGDPCMGLDVVCGANRGPFFSIEFLHGHGQFSDKLYNQIYKTCSLDELYYGVSDPACAALVNQVNSQVGGYYSYGLYDECGALNIQSTHVKLNAAEERPFWDRTSLHGALNDYPCGGYPAMLAWAQNPVVKKALNVAPNAKFFSGDNGDGLNYTLTERSVLPIIIDAVHNRGLRVLVYNGDTDPGINSFLTQNWTLALNLPEQEAWRPWTLDGQARMGGYVTRYTPNFDFLTIRGAGHMVPEYKSAAALEFLTRWLRNEPWQPYTPSPSGRRRM